MKLYPMVDGSGVTPAGYFLTNIPMEPLRAIDHTGEMVREPTRGREVQRPERIEGHAVHDCSSAQLAVQFSPEIPWQAEG